MIIITLTLILSIIACVFSIINFVMNLITRKKMRKEPALIEKLTLEHQIKRIGHLRKKIMKKRKKDAKKAQ